MLKKLHYVHHGRILVINSVFILASLGEEGLRRWVLELGVLGCRDCSIDRQRREA
jgi:hypothetical protein